MTNFDVLIKEHPEVVRECVEHRIYNLKVTSDGKIQVCADGYCSDHCIFNSSNAYAPYSDGQYLDCCSERISHWLKRSASTINNDDSDIRNKDGDITW